MNQTIETMTSASNEAIKEGFEKTLSAVNDASGFHKENMDAVIESATVAGKGIEAVNANAVAYAKSAMEEGVAVAKAVSSAKSVQEIFEIQSDYAKSSMDAYLAELNKTSELFSDLMKSSVKPLNDRVSAAVELAQSQR
ncbi:MAG: TIGR01841 family phasin [Alphaproteobacteria bacterium]|nr:TIGR01841 family phasin [Alphaproteobacteria bacterium]